MLERVIEEQASVAVQAVTDRNLSSVRPSSPAAWRFKETLIRQGIWSQYLVVGNGPDADIFTKAQPMGSVGTGAEVGIHSQSEWKNSWP